MASGPTEEGLTVTLPPDLEEWLDDRARKLGVDREAVLRQLLASYRAAAELDDNQPVPPGGPITEVVERELAAHLDAELEAAVESVLADTLEDHVETAVRSQLGAALESELNDRISEATAAVRGDLGERLDEMEADYTEKLEDVRERVIQVKRETDAKAPADHTHEEPDRLGDLADRIEELVADLEDIEHRVSDHEAATEDVTERLDETRQRLRTVAWVVSDLREAHEEGGGMEAVERIKRAAARADVDRAKCESCGNGVEIALLTDPECPHCETTVTNVEPAEGFFGKPRLVVASQLESGDSA